jgi:selenocysteine lyase/cysteine desulfurase
MTSRRQFLTQASLASAASLALSAPAAALDGFVSPAEPRREDLTPPDAPPHVVAQDETYWQRVAKQYAITDRTTNLEAGFFGMMPAPVLAAFHANIDRVNRESSWFARRDYPGLLQAARARVATALSVAPTELAFARNATEALQALIGQYNRLQSGDTVMYADLDYTAMQWSMNALAERQGATVARFDLPEPATREAIVAAYATALDAHPRTRLLLLTHCNNKTGLIHPVAEITALAKARGVDVVVDAAHSFGQVPLAVPDFGADFVGLNLHKWVGAPVGAAVMYIREGALERIDRAHGDEGSLDRIDSRLHTGTTHFATSLTIPDALDFQDQIGVANKAARLRFLRDRWVRPAREIPGIDILTPDDADLVGAITSFRVRGQGSREANQAVVRALHDEFGIFTVWRNGIARGDCVRVTPALYNTPADADKLVAALRVIASR